MAPPENDEVADPDTDPRLFSRVAEVLRKHRGGHSSEQLVEELREAQAEIEVFHAAHPESVPALRLLAECSLQLGDLTSARACISRAEVLDPWNLEILIISESLYETEIEMGQRDFVLRLSSDLDSNAINAETLMEKAMGSFRLGDIERAYSLAKLAYLLSPQSGHLLMEIWGVGTALDPVRTYNELLCLDQQGELTPYLQLALGSTCNVLGSYERAVEWLTAGIQKGPEDPYVLAMLYNELAYVLAKQGQHLHRCVALARSALELFPDEKANGFIRDTLGVAYLKKGEIDKAISNLRESVSKDPTCIPRFHLALALLHQKEALGALHELRQVAAARPSLECPHVEETKILERVQSQIGRLEDLLHLGGADDIRDALEILEDLV